MDINELIKRKNEIIEELRDDVESNELLPYDKKALEEELEAIYELESDIGADLETAERDGVYFIAEDGFRDYAEEFAYDIGRIESRSYEWPYNHIDWDAAAQDLKYDFSEVEWQGNIYLFRY